ncbi:hypothetical protein [Hirschia litorea]|uniref:Lipoprotein n=1 Tax=Hirschia litorea TaxID=1199156 RepID=A0ABW2IKW4_9PROT
MKMWKWTLIVATILAVAFATKIILKEAKQKREDAVTTKIVLAISRDYCIASLMGSNGIILPSEHHVTKGRFKSFIPPKNQPEDEQGTAWSSTSDTPVQIEHADDDFCKLLIFSRYPEKLERDFLKHYKNFAWGFSEQGRFTRNGRQNAYGCISVFPDKTKKDRPKSIVLHWAYPRTEFSEQIQSLFSRRPYATMILSISKSDITCKEDKSLIVKHIKKEKADMELMETDPELYFEQERKKREEWLANQPSE